MEIMRRGCDVYFKIVAEDSGVVEIGRAKESTLRGFQKGYFDGFYIQSIRASDIGDTLIMNFQKLAL